MHIPKKALSTAILTGTALLLTTGIAAAGAVVNLTASRQSTILPDGNSVPMWGWTCGTGTAAASGATCTSLNYVNGALTPQIGGTTWQPPLIVVPYVAGSTSLTINLTNALPVETSLVILGQSGGASELRSEKRVHARTEPTAGRPRRLGPRSIPAPSYHPRKATACAPLPRLKFRELRRLARRLSRPERREHRRLILGRI